LKQTLAAYGGFKNSPKPHAPISKKASKPLATREATPEKRRQQSRTFLPRLKEAFEGAK